MKFRSIAVEGPIGVGKTSFVELLARKFDAHRVLEQFENPFLDAFYQEHCRCGDLNTDTTDPERVVMWCSCGGRIARRIPACEPDSRDDR